MPRAPILPSVAKASGRNERPSYAGTESPALEPDDYASRLVKYVPAEALAFFFPFSAIPGISETQIAVVLIVGTIGAVVWAINMTGKLEATLRSPWWLIGTFAAIGFSAWALGISDAARHLVGVSNLTAAIIAASVTFLLPAVDELLVADQ